MSRGRYGSRSMLAAAVGAAALLSTAGVSFGQSAGASLFTWNGGSNLWSTATNWTQDPANSPQRAPSASTGTDFAIFPGVPANGARYAIDLAASARNTRGIRFDSGGSNAYTLSVSGLLTTTTSYGINLRKDGITNNSSNTETFNTPIRFFTLAGGTPGSTDSFTIAANSGNLVFTGTWTVPAGGTTLSMLALNGSAGTTSGGVIFDGAKDITMGSTGRGDIIGPGGTVTKNGAGKLTLGGTAANTYSGLTTVNAGTLFLNKTGGVNAIVGNLTIAGGAVQLGTNNEIADTSVVNVSGGAFDLNGKSDTVGAVTISGGGSVSGGTLTGASYAAQQGSASGLAGAGIKLTKSTANDFTLGTNTYGGGTEIQAGKLIANNASGNATGSGTVKVDATGILTTTTGGSVGAVNVLAGGTITAAPSQVLVVNGDAVIAGTSSGNIQYTGNVSVSGTISPGNSPGVITVGGDLTLSGSTDMELAGTAPSQYDQINVTGAMNFGGDLNVTLIGGFTPAAGDTFDLFDFASHTGSFAHVLLPSLDPSLLWNTSNLYTTGEISVARAVPLPASVWTGLGLLGCVGVARRFRKPHVA